MVKRSKGAKLVWLAYLGLAAMPLVASGCLVIAAGAAGGAAVAGYAYYKGEVFNRYAANLPDTVAALRLVLAEMGMPVINEQVNEGSSVIESRTPQNERVHISLTSQIGQSPAEGITTLVGVRVGIFGDTPLSEQLLGRIGAHLVPGGVIRPMPMPPSPVLGPIQPVSAALPPSETPPPPLAREPIPVR
jgi:hypothetical protein